MKKLVTLLFVLATVMVANAQTDSLYIVSVATPEYYNEEMDCLDLTNWCADTLVIYDDDPDANEFNILWYYYGTDGPWMYARSIMITKENEGRWIFKNERTNAFAEFMITLATTPEETKVSFEREVPLGEEIFAYDLINDVKNPKLSIAWDDGESGYSRTACEERVYTVTVSDSCGREVTNTWRVGDWTGTHETVSSNTSIYPNPAHGAFTVRGEDTLVIFNSIGQKVRESKIDNETIIDGLPAGMYFVQVGGNVPQKVVVVE